jgi:Holliday junction resolvasome RuvABC endonuclease subunit
MEVQFLYLLVSTNTPDGGFKVVEEGVIAEVLEAEAVEEETEEVVEEEVVEAAEDGDMETRLASLEKAVSELMEKLAEDKT